MLVPMSVTKNAFESLMDRGDRDSSHVMEDRKRVWITMNWLQGIGVEREEGGKFLRWNDTVTDIEEWVYRLLYNSATKIY